MLKMHHILLGAGLSQTPSVPVLGFGLAVNFRGRAQRAPACPACVAAPLVALTRPDYGA